VGITIKLLKKALKSKTLTTILPNDLLHKAIVFNSAILIQLCSLFNGQNLLQFHVSLLFIPQLLKHHWEIFYESYSLSLVYINQLTDVIYHFVLWGLEIIHKMLLECWLFLEVRMIFLFYCSTFCTILYFPIYSD